jgi:esterase
MGSNDAPLFLQDDELLGESRRDPGASGCCRSKQRRLTTLICLRYARRSPAIAPDPTRAGWRAWVDPFSLRRVPEAEINGVRLYYEDRGEGAPIACIHGGGSSAMMWGDAVKELARLGQVISYDRRGCARSERPEPYERTTVTEQADDASALLDALEATPAVVMGRSYGGAVAIGLAIRHSEQVRALVLLEGDALGLSPAGLEWTKRLRERLRDVAARDGHDAVNEALIEEVMGEGVWDSFPEEVRRVLAQNGPALLAELHYVDEPMPDAAAFAAIDVPSLLVAGSDSPPEQRDMTEKMAEVLPNARLVQVAGGHLVDPAGPKVLAFIEEVLGAG